MGQMKRVKCRIGRRISNVTARSPLTEEAPVMPTLPRLLPSSAPGGYIEFTLTVLLLLSVSTPESAMIDEFTSIAEHVIGLGRCRSADHRAIIADRNINVVTRTLSNPLVMNLKVRFRLSSPEWLGWSRLRVSVKM